MVEVKLGPRTVDLPYTLRVYGVTEEMFDELTDEDTRAELFDGVMIVHSPASTRHDRVAGFLRRLMAGYAEEKDLGEVLGPDSLIHLSTCRRFAPDGYFLTEKRIPDPFPEEHFEGAPDLVLEVLSPSNRDEDLEDKRPAYRQAGVGEIWFVDPHGEEVIIDRRRKRGRSYTTTTVTAGRATSDVLPGFWIDVGWLRKSRLPKVLRCLRAVLGTDVP
jgi:Uma2 family endonuclease